MSKRTKKIPVPAKGDLLLLRKDLYACKSQPFIVTKVWDGRHLAAGYRAKWGCAGINSDGTFFEYLSDTCFDSSVP